jgi:hypothetical protein
MTDAGCIEAILSAAIRMLQNRDEGLTPVERLKLRSLLLNLETLQSRPRSAGNRPHIVERSTPDRNSAAAGER